MEQRFKFFQSGTTAVEVDRKSSYYKRSFEIKLLDNYGKNIRKL